MRPIKGVAHLEGSCQGAREPSSHAAVIVAYVRCGLGSSPGVGPDTHPRSRSPGVDSINRVAPVTHQDQGETEKPAGLSLSPLARGAPENCRYPATSMAFAHSTELVAAWWLHPSRGSRPRRLSPLTGGERVWVGRREANQKRRACSHPPLETPHACPRIPHAANARVT